MKESFYEIKTSKMKKYHLTCLVLKLYLRKINYFCSTGFFRNPISNAVTKEPIKIANT